MSRTHISLGQSWRRSQDIPCSDCLAYRCTLIANCYGPKGDLGLKSWVALWDSPLFLLTGLDHSNPSLDMPCVFPEKAIYMSLDCISQDPGRGYDFKACCTAYLKEIQNWAAQKACTRVRNAFAFLMALLR